jgi:hypothetical protein
LKSKNIKIKQLSKKQKKVPQIDSNFMDCFSFFGTKDIRKATKRGTQSKQLKIIKRVLFFFLIYQNLVQKIQRKHILCNF